MDFSNFSVSFQIPKFYSNLNSNCSNLLDMKNLQIKKAKIFWPFTIWINCSSDLKNFANTWPSASNFKKKSQSLEHFFLTVGQNNFCNKIPNLPLSCFWVNIFSDQTWSWPMCCWKKLRRWWRIDLFSRCIIQLQKPNNNMTILV